MVTCHISPVQIFLLFKFLFLFEQIEKEIGEQRVISFHGVGLSVAEEIKYGDVTAQTQNADEVCKLSCFISVYLLMFLL
jgi:glycerol-3-phosphate O-acyltransferase